MIRTNPVRTVRSEKNMQVKIQVKDLTNGNEYLLEKTAWSSVGQLKAELQQKMGLKSAFQRLFCLNYEMRNQDLLLDYITDEKKPYFKNAQSFVKAFKVDFPIFEDLGSINSTKGQKMSNLLEIQVLPKNQFNSKIGRINQIKENMELTMTGIIKAV